jgi:hypothetical protein
MIWVGRRFYKPAEFIAEAIVLGVSRRIPWAIPRARRNRDWVFVAHPSGMIVPCNCAPLVRVSGKAGCKNCQGTGRRDVAALIYVFKLHRIVTLIPDDMPHAERVRLTKKGLDLIEVPADDPDHQEPRRKTRKEKQAEQQELDMAPEVEA